MACRQNSSAEWTPVSRRSRKAAVECNSGSGPERSSIPIPSLELDSEVFDSLKIPGQLKKDNIANETCQKTHSIYHPTQKKAVARSTKSASRAKELSARRRRWSQLARTADARQSRTSSRGQTASPECRTCPADPPLIPSSPRTRRLALCRQQTRVRSVAPGHTLCSRRLPQSHSTLVDAPTTQLRAGSSDAGGRCQLKAPGPTLPAYPSPAAAARKFSPVFRQECPRRRPQQILSRMLPSSCPSKAFAGPQGGKRTGS